MKALMASASSVPASRSVIASATVFMILSVL
jgi:hypothetical protein